MGPRSRACERRAPNHDKVLTEARASSTRKPTKLSSRLRAAAVPMKITPLQPPPRSTLYECEWWCTPSVAAAQLRKVLEPYQSMVRYARHALIYFSMGRLTCLNATPCTHELSLGDMTRAHRSVSSPGPHSCGVGHGDASRVHHPTGLSGE